MKIGFNYNTELGEIYIEENGYAITKLSFVDDKEVIIGKREETDLIRETVKQLEEYFIGERKTFNIPLIYKGTKFQLKVWEELKKIKYGETKSYKEIADKIGIKNGARAVGGANNKNPILILIPCHRVISASGDLSGYAGGIKIKKKLLEIETEIINKNIKE